MRSIFLIVFFGFSSFIKAQAVQSEVKYVMDSEYSSSLVGTTMYYEVAGKKGRFHFRILDFSNQVLHFFKQINY